MTFGFSRDDIGKFLRVYQDKKILDKDPFATFDVDGVGPVLRIGRRAGTPRAPRSQDRRLRRARRRPLVDPLLREGRAQLRELFALPRAGGASCRRAGGAGGQSRGLMRAVTRRLITSFTFIRTATRRARIDDRPRRG